MKTWTFITLLSLSAGFAMAGENTPVQLKPTPESIKQTQSTLSNPELKNNQTIPTEVTSAMDEMSEARAKYQKTQEKALATEKEKDELRDKLAEQANERERMREQLQIMRNRLPEHEQVIEQAREQARSRRGND